MQCNIWFAADEQSHTSFYNIKAEKFFTQRRGIEKSLFSDTLILSWYDFEL